MISGINCRYSDWKCMFLRYTMETVTVPTTMLGIIHVSLVHSKCGKSNSISFVSGLLDATKGFQWTRKTLRSLVCPTAQEGWCLSFTEKSPGLGKFTMTDIKDEIWGFLSPLRCHKKTLSPFPSSACSSAAPSAHAMLFDPSTPLTRSSSTRILQLNYYLLCDASAIHTHSRCTETVWV